MAHQLEEGAAPGTPPSGYVAMYAKADGQLYSKDDAGVETPLGLSGSAFLAALGGLSSNGIVVKTGAAAAAVRTIQAGSGISVTNGDAVAADPIIALTASVLNDPTTTDGDMIYRDSGIQRLPIGTEEQILRVVSGLPVWADENLGQDFGDGSDGDVIISAPVTLTDAMFYNNLSIVAGGSLNTGGYPVYAKTLDLSNAPANAIHRNGGNGGGATGAGGGTAGSTSATQIVGTGGNGGIGGVSTATTGGSGSAGVAVAPSNGGSGGTGAAGGAGTGGAGGTAVAGGTAATPMHIGRFDAQLLRGAAVMLGGAGGRGGGAGGGNGTVSGRGGGGGGAGGGVLAIYADNIITSGSTASGAIRSMGGNGGTSNGIATVGAGGGAGGGGGGGGFVYLAYNTKTGPAVVSLIVATGGTGGNGANCVAGGGTAGAGSSGGNGGRIQVFEGMTTTGTQVIGAVGTAGTAAVGTVGGTGGGGGLCSLTL